LSIQPQGKEKRGSGTSIEELEKRSKTEREKNQDVC